MPTWDELFKDEDNRWKEPHESLVDVIKSLKSRTRVKRVLDLGCGAGRHVVYLSGEGYEAYGMDLSFSGLQFSREWLARQGHPTRLAMADMTSLPFANTSFDMVVSMFVIHHNLLAGLRKSIHEIYRMLVPGGYTLLTLNSTRGYRHDTGRQLEPGTVIPDIGKDRGIPHHFSDLQEIAREFIRFIVREIHLEEVTSEEGYLSSHWVILAEKPKEDQE
ncbi:MAG: class I SAM-dependent methyltransferase [Anaerolineaceae bacterium]